MRKSNEHGIAMITTLLVMMLISAVLVGFTAVVMSDQRYRLIDRDRGQAFYAASGAMEKLTADLGNMFLANLSPTAGQVTTLTSSAPSIAGVTYSGSSAPVPLPASSLSNYYCSPTATPAKHTVTTGTTGYTIIFCTDATGNPVTTTTSPIKLGPYEGLIAEQTPYQLDVTAHTSTGGEVHLIRTIESVAIPVFQFGMFSDVDLAFNAGDNFTFGGRVHTNSNLYLAEAGGATLTLSDKVTAVKEVVRQRLSNGVSIDDSGHTGTVKMAKAPGSFRNLARTEGSVTDGPTSAQNEPTWHGISLSTYNSYIRNGRTGAKTLNLPLITVGGTNPDLVRRPVVNENTTNAILFGERLFSKASLRILLSDTVADITNLPTVTAAPAPVLLDGNWNVAGVPAGYGPIDSSHPPIAMSTGVITATMTGSGGGTITFASAATAAPFKPVFTLCNGPFPCATTTTIACTGKTAAAPWQLTGCTGTPGMPITAAGATLTAVSPANGSAGATTVTTVATTAASTTIQMASAAELGLFKPMPFWDTNAATATDKLLVTCTDYTTTSYTGCSSNPAGLTLTSAALTNNTAGRIGGYIKIEYQDNNSVWRDITMEILNYGIGGPNHGGTICADPTPNAILRIQRLRDNNNGCTYNTDATGAKDPTNWWANALFDTRESQLRDVNPGNNNLTIGGVMYYIALDAGNLVKWFRAAGAYNTGSGAGARTDNNGFTVYFSDRRNNRTAANLETGEYGWEDFVNPTVAGGAPNGTLDPAEDVNANTLLDTYGGLPNYNGASGTLPPGSVAPYAAASTPPTALTYPQAVVNRPILFRRALKLINGATIAGATGVTGLTIVAENPIYVQGDWNAIANFTGAHAATAVISDAITLLSNNWNDINSFQSPYNHAGRKRAPDTYYRMAVIAGKGAIFAHPAGTGTTFGTDGGAHAFMRFLEGTGNAPDAYHYRGSLATFFYNRQAVGTFKCCTTVYAVPSFRDYAFDTDFLTPALLPPNTPVFRDMNAVGFSQELRPGR